MLLNKVTIQFLTKCERCIPIGKSHLKVYFKHIHLKSNFLPFSYTQENGIRNNNAIFATDCTMATLKRSENVTFNIYHMKPDVETLEEANVSHCLQPEIRVGQLLPAFVPMPNLSLADNNYLPYNEIYEQLAAYDSKQLNYCLPKPKD